MRKISLVTILCTLLLAACSHDEWMDATTSETQGAVFKLTDADYKDKSPHAASRTTTAYDRLEHFIVDSEGCRVKDIKSKYNPNTSEIIVEGLHEGDYHLLVLGIRGNESHDHAEISVPEREEDTWLSFPVDLNKPLEAEYFYSQTPFNVSLQQTESGQQEIINGRQEVELRRIVCRLDFSFTYHNPYVRNAVTEQTATLNRTRFRTAMAANGTLSGESDGNMEELSLTETTSYCFMPTASEYPLTGEVELHTRDYRGNGVRQTYAFQLEQTFPNHIHMVNTEVEHPDDRSALMFITKTAYLEGNHTRILQDGEPKEVYTDPKQRQFDTAQPLQLELTENGQLHVRFYSPRGLSGVLVKSRIPAVSNEFFDLAYFDTIPSFADFYESLPLVKHTAMCATESGRLIEAGPLEAADLTNAEFRIETTDPYWSKLQQIEHGWTIRWGLYGGDPDREDGGPVGNWMGIRPVHCRESVALFLNFTYMVDMPEHEQILRENAGKLYDDNKKPIQVEQVLQQMRQRRTLQVGLVYPGNGVIGLGGGSTFGAYQQAWFEHYWNTYSCSIMFHELGHVMGYGHNSSFTYGPWAEELMNNFYVQNISNFPIDSPDYLNSKTNPNRYQ